MSEKQAPDTISSRIWHEEPEPDNPFAARAAYCRGYDVYGEMLGQARWVEMLYLLFREDAPIAAQTDLLEALALALANPGPRDASVHAAMCGGVCGSPAAASLIAALSVGAGQLAGGREIFVCLERWASCGTDLDAWRERLAAPPVSRGTIWPASEHPPGFDPHGATTATPVRQTLSCLARYGVGPHLTWLEEHRADLERLAGCPLSMSGVAAAAFADLGFTPEQAEMLHLLLRLPGAAAHALEQKSLGYKKFPFGTVELESDFAEEQT
ncbi:citryl-CoA lyase [Noviherbaspirillum cavernae]|uniref:Citryl-CoA lyase n=1 Tax=Noviherbaspirillum cavernae TaxID=2320862 RepID=A0A418WXI3_9BURK|nr:citryl-CoA lyase [Noviherbaspirillum cavernae]RJG04934.1 citryl-CoA lyase [Noviherbaspirillum cavernae]